MISQQQPSTWHESGTSVSYRCRYTSRNPTERQPPLMFFLSSRLYVIFRLMTIHLLKIPIVCRVSGKFSFSFDGFAADVCGYSFAMSKTHIVIGSSEGVKLKIKTASRGHVFRFVMTPVFGAQCENSSASVSCEPQPH
ncbi:hypothetical protein F2P81_017475 [Scophthalmus maximus]|uniref:Uncharacterized protein n=1 Tax=Scophthalmus maximus TaxID=52904 RepID=A0A6A4SIE7_SCOMX|nr:hypothetical protein F2P81_017475 [Scophthalmus maximus]